MTAVAIEPGRLNDIREGRRGVALGLYIDVDDDEWEDYTLAVPTVLALDTEAGKRLLESLRDALEAGWAQEVSDDASDAVSIVLASGLQDQALIARMLDNLCARPDASFDLRLKPAS